jgi:hypothetical protein
MQKDIEEDLKRRIREKTNNELQFRKIEIKLS